MRIKERNTYVREKLINSAWELFREKGYEATTVNDIIEHSETSKGSFYHHFRGKEDLVFCLAYFFDEDYETWIASLDTDMTGLEKLAAFDEFILKNLEESPYMHFFPTLYGLQVMTAGQRYILDPERLYYRTIRQFAKECVENNELKPELSATSLAETYPSLQRGCTYDWCLNKQSFSIYERGHKLMMAYLNSIKR